MRDFLTDARKRGAACALLLLTLILTCVASCGKSDDSSVQEILIISPHGSDIRREFEQGFSKWHLKKYGTDVKLRWPDIGGTGNVSTQLAGDYKAGNSSGYDLVFGGGSATFNDYARQGFLVKPPIDDAVLKRVPAEIFGTPLHGPGDVWIAATMSNFGIDYNKDRLRELGLATPRVWEDLAAPGMFGNLSLADPSKSGSVRTTYDQVFLQYGWEKGWRVITRMFANADNIRDSGSGPADDVGSAQAAAGIAIDFFGRKEILRVGENIVGFVIPEGGSITDPDPIAMLKGASHPELAAQFIEFVISEEGQKLWTLRAGTPGGGPNHFVLGRLSVLPEMYEKYAGEMFDPTNPFAAKQPLKAIPTETSFRNAFLGDLIKSALIDNRSEMIAAQRAILAAGDPPDLLEKFDTLPTFIPTRVNGTELVEEPAMPVTAKEEGTLSAEFKPPAPRPTDPPEVQHEKGVKLANAGKLQDRLKNHWRTEFLQRFRTLRSEAETRRK